jgi:large conductance mechanosensitive channel
MLSSFYSILLAKISLNYNKTKKSANFVQLKKQNIMGVKKVIEDFKSFAIKGNMIDMAVGIIIGGAFGKIITSLVNDVIMPPLGVLIGGVNFTDLKITLKAAEGEMAAVTLNYGNFLQVCFDFLIIAFSIFCFVRLLSKLKSKKEKEEVAAPAPAPSKEEVLLAEIRDILKEQNNK